MAASNAISWSCFISRAITCLSLFCAQVVQSQNPIVNQTSGYSNPYVTTVAPDTTTTDATTTVVETNLTATVPTSWLPEDFPNPQLEPYKCGRHGKASFICDPNSLISNRDAARLDEMIDDIRVNTPCPCDSECPTGKEGHLIGIAIMEKMDLPQGTFGTFEELQLSVERFATFLRTDSWHFSHCTNDAVIVISVQDKTIFTSPGPKARERLLSRCIDKAFLHARFKFSKEQYYDGLRTILADYKQYIKQGDCPGIEGPSIAGIVLGSLFMSIVVICVLFCIYECITRRRAAQRRRRKFDFSSSLGNNPPSSSARSHFQPAGCLLPVHERPSQDERPPRPPPPQFTKGSFKGFGSKDHQSAMKKFQNDAEGIESES